MTFQELLTLLQTLSIVVALLVGVGTLVSRRDSKSNALTEMQVDIKYIKSSLDKIDPMNDRLRGCEESTKSAHKRLDEHIAGHRKDDGG